MQQNFTYPLELTADEDGALTATFPDIPEAITGGESRAETLALAADALETALAGYIQDRREIPAPSAAAGRPTASPGATIAAKAAIYTAMREQGVTNVDLARRLGVGEHEVRVRILNPRHATRMERLQAALAALGKRAVLTVEDA